MNIGVCSKYPRRNLINITHWSPSVSPMCRMFRKTLKQGVAYLRLRAPRFKLKFIILMSFFFIISSVWSAPVMAQIFGFFGPKDREECHVKAAHDAKSAASLNVLLISCNREFEAVRKIGGGYHYFDNRTSEYVDVSNGKLTAADRIIIERRFAEFRSDKINKEEYLWRRVERVLSGIIIQDKKLACEGISCLKSTLSISFKNTTYETIYGLRVGFDFVTGNKCPTDLNMLDDVRIKVGPMESGVLSITRQLEDSQGRSYCVSFLGVAFDNIRDRDGKIEMLIIRR
jgi:hypothetical protein